MSKGHRAAIGWLKLSTSLLVSIFLVGTALADDVPKKKKGKKAESPVIEVIRDRGATRTSTATASLPHRPQVPGQPGLSPRRRSMN